MILLLKAFIARNSASLAVGAIVLWVAAYHLVAVSSAYRRGAEAARAEIEAANAKVMDKADEAEIELLAKCPTDKPWNRRTGQCSPR